jgi:hypothetical protein
VSSGGEPFVTILNTPLPVQQGAPNPANIVTASYSTTVQQSGAVLMSIPAGSVWQGNIAISVSCTQSPTGSGDGLASGIVAVAGTGATPAPGDYIECRALCGPGSTTGVQGTEGNNSLTIPFTFAAGPNASAELQVNTLTSGSAAYITVSASGALV